MHGSFPHRLTTKWSINLLVCRCCTPCTTGRGSSTLLHRSQLHCWLLPTILVFGWHDFRAFLGDFKRELQVQYFSLPEGEEDSTLPLTCHPSHDDILYCSLFTGNTYLLFVFLILYHWIAEDSVPPLAVSTPLACSTSKDATTVALVFQCLLRSIAAVFSLKSDIMSPLLPPLSFSGEEIHSSFGSNINGLLLLPCSFGNSAPS